MLGSNMSIVEVVQQQLLTHTANTSTTVCSRRCVTGTCCTAAGGIASISAGAGKGVLPRTHTM